MLAIKLKNNHNFAMILALAVLLCAAFGMVSAYPAFSEEMKKELDGELLNENILEDISKSLVQGNRFLYNEIYEETDVNQMMETYANDRFFLYRKYMDCEMFDAKGKPLTGKNDKKTIQKLIKPDTNYAFRVAFLFDEEGGVKNIEVDGTGLEAAAQYRIEKKLYDVQDYTYLGSPCKVKAVYGFTRENLMKYERESFYTGFLYAQELAVNKTYRMFEGILVFVVAIAAVLISLKKKWQIAEMKIFHAPLELVMIVWFYAVSLKRFYAEVVWNTLQHSLAKTAERMGMNGMLNLGIEKILNVFMWFCVFAIVFWGVTCLMTVFTMKEDYWKERTVCAKIWRWWKNKKISCKDKVNVGAKKIWKFLEKSRDKIRSGAHHVYEGLLHIDFRDQTNKTIARIVILNFILLALISFLWYYGIFALMIYSAALFLFLRKYFRDIQKKYTLLLQTTNLLAEGNLDAPIEGDMGIFNPIKTELKKIQTGFKRAVQKEVKSERMKTELVTNVSHDLKTPLTAIITYVDLLKSEKDPEKQREYLEVLERKSLRLKVLIEDLFEISKAASKTVTMNYMQIDIAGLLKQVGLECEEKIKASELDFRWNLPEEKVVLTLDSQKTYRIFENLIVNITKYALPRTRVYIDLKEREGDVLISMKNVSAEELNFNTDEITDRFVRGDAARNTEGSGLGLAIAKSFTELQHGTLTISTDGDLFKAEISFPK